MQYYKTHAHKLTGTHWPRLIKKAFGQYKEIIGKSKRRPYVRSAYFGKQKIFLGLFWQHLHEKNSRDKTRRVALFPCAIELIQKTKQEPISKENPNKNGEILHRFAGSTPNNEIFFVQIKEDRQTAQKYLISVFPLDK
ncbi:MAG: hypothetical protein A2538_02900 [Candidatus Magasanikbacteria bacterium RIFOXYD2_FULL_41_14]|uniref:Uncharacterized protein n=1 Tax=Candidatus Magasanikbacteria bacterium RIFOXYD2_FULL_41_14 TaxID=1798709 RepID=A0A1F6PCF0_9BACT|nr:MAG: hypothetical protein A2538_02900 [Candidatus Magasanikbacteria bacterium RIFOXYD2_FULL_41_14]